MRVARALAVTAAAVAALGTGCSFAPAGGGAEGDGSVGDVATDTFVALSDARFDAPGDARPDAPPQCPADFVTVFGAPTTSVYKFYSYSLIPGSDGRQPWPAAAATCASQGSHMWIADSAGEAAAVIPHIHPAPTLGYVADGVTDAAVEGTWLDVLGHPAGYLPWFPGQPDGAGGGDGDCGLLDLTGKLFDYYCDAAHPYAFACECEH